MPFTEHDFVAYWVGFVDYYLKTGWEFEDLKPLKKYSAEGWYKAFSKAMAKTKWKKDTKCSLSTMRKYFPSVYEK